MVRGFWGIVYISLGAVVSAMYITWSCNSGLVPKPADHDDGFGDWDEAVWGEAEESDDRWEDDTSDWYQNDWKDHWDWDESYDWDEWEYGSNLDGEPIDSDLDGVPMSAHFDGEPLHSKSHGQTRSLTWDLGFEQTCNLQCDLIPRVMWGLSFKHIQTIESKRWNCLQGSSEDDESLTWEEYVPYQLWVSRNCFLVECMILRFKKSMLLCSYKLHVLTQ